MIALQISLALISALLVAFAGLIWRANPDRSANRWFAVFTLLVGCWSFGIAQLYAGNSLDFWARFTFASASLIPAAFFGFTRSYQPLAPWPAAWVLPATVAAGVALAFLSFATPLILRDVSSSGFDLSREYGPLHPVFAGYFIVLWATSLVFLLTQWKRARGLQRLQLQYLCGGIAVSLSGAVITNLLLPVMTGRSTHSWLGPYFGLSFIALVGHAIIRHRLMALRVVVHRGLIFTVAVLVSLIPMAAVVALFWPRITTTFDSFEIGAIVVALGCAGLLIPVTRDATARAFDRYVYRRHTNYQRTLRDASRALTAVLELRRLQDFLQRTIAQTVECEGIAIYIQRGATLRKRTVELKHPGADFGAPENFPDVILESVRDNRDVLVTDELVRPQQNTRLAGLQSELRDLNWALVLPAISENNVIGAIVLGPKRSGDPYYPQDLDLLMTLANQAGIAIKNAQLYAQVVLVNEHLENILGTVTSGVVAVDADGAVTMFNRAAEQLTGLAHAGVRAQPLAALPARLGDALGATLGDGIARTQPDIDLSDGRITRPIMLMTSPLRDPDGALLGAVAVFSDLTPVRALEIERRRVERLAYLETFASGIAHEVKNPLVAIKTFAQLLPRRRADERFIDEFSRIVTREIGRMERLIERLRTLSRPGQRERRLLDIRQPLVDALEFMQPSFEDKDVRVEAALGETEAPVFGDAGELEQLFLNLLMNANDAAPRHGRIVVAVLAGDGRVAVAVADNGPGIADDALGRVFDPFFTTKERGSGLGLAICAGIADTHGARLRAENVPTGGARFTVEFPLASEVTAPVIS